MIFHRPRSHSLWPDAIATREITQIADEVTLFDFGGQDVRRLCQRSRVVIVRATHQGGEHIRDVPCVLCHDVKDLRALAGIRHEIHTALVGLPVGLRLKARQSQKTFEYVSYDGGGWFPPPLKDCRRTLALNPLDVNNDLEIFR